VKIYKFGPAVLQEVSGFQIKIGQPINVASSRKTIVLGTISIGILLLANYSSRDNSLQVLLLAIFILLLGFLMLITIPIKGDILIDKNLGKIWLSRIYLTPFVHRKRKETYIFRLSQIKSIGAQKSLIPTNVINDVQLFLGNNTIIDIGFFDSSADFKTTITTLKRWVASEKGGINEPNMKQRKLRLRQGFFAYPPIFISGFWISLFLYLLLKYTGLVFRIPIPGVYPILAIILGLLVSLYLGDLKFKKQIGLFIYAFSSAYLYMFQVNRGIALKPGIDFVFGSFLVWLIATRMKFRLPDRPIEKIINPSRRRVYFISVSLAIMIILSIFY
jgi:hypothetical protein